MNAALASVVLASLLVTSAPAQLTDNDSETVAQIGDETIPRGAYEDWLFTRFSAESITEYLDTVVIERAARDQGLSISAEDVDAALEAETQIKVDRFFKGDRAAFDADTERRGYTAEMWRLYRGSQLRHELLSERLVRAARVVSEDQIKVRYKSIYGQDNERTDLEIIFFNIYHDADPEERVPRDELMRRSRERADRVVAKMRDGAPLSELRELSDLITNKFITEGRVERYRRNLLGPALDKAITLLDRPGEVTEIVQLFDGHAAARLVGREEMTYERAHEELHAELMAAPATAAELAQVVETAKATYGVEPLLAK